MSTEVFSTACCPMPMETSSQPEFDTFYEQFFSDFPSLGDQQQPAMSMQQPPEHPMFDSPHQHSLPASALVKQEIESGFLSGLLDPEDIDRYSPEEKKRYESHLIKEELQCHLKLKMMKEGKDFGSEAEDQSEAKEYPISEETRQLQQNRREKNREAAKKCRQKKKASEREQEQKIREAERKIHEMKLQLAHSQQEFAAVLESFHSLPCFIAYLRHNRHLVRNPLLKPVLQKFVRAHGGQMAMGGSPCTVCPTVSNQTALLGYSVEQ